jgi:CO dehydrogenase nickel-insertion accessory protein CooC1
MVELCGKGGTGSTQVAALRAQGAAMGELCGKGGTGSTGSRFQAVYAWPASAEQEDCVELSVIDFDRPRPTWQALISEQSI